jgi:transglutaminase-like putative cysteine protease
MKSARYRIRHETTYNYGAEVVHSHQVLHLKPRALEFQDVHEHAIEIDPQPSSDLRSDDPFGNPIARLEIDRAHMKLRVASTMTATVRARPETKGETLPWEQVRSRLMYSGRPPQPDALEAARFRFESPYVRIKQAFNEFAEDCFPAEAPIFQCADRLMQKLHRDMTYAPGDTSISTPLLEVLERRRGVCQDYAHLMTACVRSRGLAARYVSGYLRTHPAPGTQRLLGSDASHAWVAVFCPPIGWVEFDPTNGILCGIDHIVLAWGRDFGDVSPLRGVIVGGGQHVVNVSVDVEEDRDSEQVNREP